MLGKDLVMWKCDVESSKDAEEDNRTAEKQPEEACQGVF